MVRTPRAKSQPSRSISVSAITQLIEFVHRGSGKTRLTTNGIAVPDRLASVLRAHRTEVKLSLHGDRAHHNNMVGCDAFERTTENLRRLATTGVRVSVQTTVVTGGEWVVEWMVAFCLNMGVKRLSILPFIPRGNGRQRRDEYALTTSAREQLHELVTRKRKSLNGRLDVRWLDFTARPIVVVESDGSVMFEAATESLDRRICQIPRLLPSEA